MVIDALHFIAGGGPARTEFGRSLENPIHDEEGLGCRAQLLQQGGVVDVGRELVRKRTQLALVIVGGGPDGSRCDGAHISRRACAYAITRARLREGVQ